MEYSKNRYDTSFKPGEIKLCDGIFLKSQNIGKDMIMSLDIDRLLAPSAYSAGAADDTSMYYGGWEKYNYRGYKGTGIAGHSLGHWLSAAAGMYAAADDNKLKERIDYAVDKLAEYQNKDGSGYIGGFEKKGFEDALAGKLEVSAFDLNGYWVPWYSIHKIYQGLIDVYNLAANEKALEVVCRFADWAVNITKDMPDDKFDRMLECEFGGMNEVMAELYDITGENKYFDLALRFSQKSILDPLSQKKDELQGKHANTQIPKIIGAAVIFEENENYTNYKTAAEFFYDTVVNNRSYVIGGNSNYEHFGSITEETLGTQTCETCNTYNMIRLAEHLYSWEHKAEYMDYCERALFNHILASQDPGSGMKTYFMATKQGHFKVYSTKEDSFWCCVGSGMENPGRYARNIYYKDGNDFYVNQFISSRVVWQENELEISQKTDYPYSDISVIKIVKGNADAVIKIRIPAWIAAAAEIKVNNEQTVSVSESGYYTIERNWNEGDTITVRLPMALHTYISRDSKNKAAFMYGPIVLAGALGKENFPESDIVSDHTSLDNTPSVKVPDIIVKNKDPETFIRPLDLSKLEFEMAADNRKIKLIPYFALHHERYSLYWNIFGEDEEIKRDEFAAALDSVTVDTVRPNEQQPEVDHGMKTNNSYSGYLGAAEKGWRCARGKDGYFSYEMKTDNTAEKNYVMALYWGSDREFSAEGVHYKREFEILANDAVIGECILDCGSPNKFIYEYYEIPREVINGKEKAEIKFRTKGADTAAGGVFEVRITTAEIKKDEI